MLVEDRVDQLHAAPAPRSSSTLESRISWVNSPFRSASTWVTSRVAGEQLLQLGVARGDGVRQPGQALAATCAPRPGCRRRSPPAPRRSWPAGRCRSPRSSSTGRRRPRPRRRATPCAPAGCARRGRARSAPRGTRARYFGAQHGLDLDRGLGAVADEGVLHPELDGDRAVLQREALDLADLDPGDAHRVVGLQAGGLGELRLVDRAAADQRQRSAR